MDHIIYQTVCAYLKTCAFVKMGGACKHAQTKRRKLSTDSFTCSANSIFIARYVASRSQSKREFIRSCICPPTYFPRVRGEPFAPWGDGVEIRSSHSDDSRALVAEMSKKFNKCYGVFRKNRRDGNIEGFVSAYKAERWDSHSVMPCSLGAAELELRHCHQAPCLRKQFDFFIVSVAP